MKYIFAEILFRQNQDYMDLDTHFTIVQILKFVFIQSIVNGGKKFHVLEQHFINNKFLNYQNLDNILTTMAKAQKTYHTLSRFIDKIASRKARIYDYNMDMGMIPLDKYAPHLLITLVENRTKYNFKLGDLITLIQKRLGNSNNFFPEPLSIVNPYTNIKITDRNMYKIYFQCKSSNYTLSPLFHQFFLSGFDLETFLDFNECLLKEYIIDDYVKHATKPQKYKKLSAMLYHYKNYTNYRYIGQSKEELYNSVSHLLVYYLRSKFSLNPNVRFKSHRIVKRELKRLVVPEPPSQTPFEKHTSRNAYRRIARDIRRPSASHNVFLFGPLNEEIDDDMDDDMDDNMDDDMDDDMDNETQLIDEDELDDIFITNWGDADGSFEGVASYSDDTILINQPIQNNANTNANTNLENQINDIFTEFEIINQAVQDL
jgi:hypothetical protein